MYIRGRSVGYWPVRGIEALVRIPGVVSPGLVVDMFEVRGRCFVFVGILFVVKGLRVAKGAAVIIHFPAWASVVTNVYSPLCSPLLLHSLHCDTLITQTTGKSTTEQAIHRDSLIAHPLPPPTQTIPQLFDLPDGSRSTTTH